LTGHIRTAAALIFLTSACAPVADTNRAGRLVLAPGGFTIGDTGLEVGFGRARDGAVAAVSRVLGTDPVSEANGEDCGGLSTVRWPNEVSMEFQGGAFVGWTAEQAGPAIASGLSPGDARADVLEQGGEFAITPRGEEFQIGGVRGVMGRSGTVSMLYSGRICTNR
jgi:hypothetical protein